MIDLSMMSMRRLSPLKSKKKYAMAGTVGSLAKPMELVISSITIELRVSGWSAAGQVHRGIINHLSTLFPVPAATNYHT
jgi:hypothetical protein